MGPGGVLARRGARRGARERLERSAKARRLTRFALRRFWEPVGSGVLPRAETGDLLQFLLGGDEGRQIIERLDEKIDRLPGLAGLRLVDRAAAGYRLT